MNNLWQSLSGFPYFALYFGLGLILLVAFIAVYLWLMPYREIQLIREGNVAAAISLSGAVLGFVLPLASAVAHSINPVDMVVWAAIAFVAQIIVYLAMSRLVPHFGEAIGAGRVAPATLLAALAVAVGVLNAACLTY
jgi:putative membrane protein